MTPQSAQLHWSSLAASALFGLAIPAVIFNNRFSQLLYTIEDESARAMLGDRKAYQLAPTAFPAQLTGVTWDQAIDVYTASLQRTWQISVIFAGFSFLVALVALCEKEIPLRQELKPDFGMEKEAETMGRKMEENCLNNNGSAHRIVSSNLVILPFK
ncbi:hypothetical protein F5Y06DRAFT_129252 [Hypoxylon sp. FL0890]|nr:hypothetical protein F5Y06DRAFT_129252 [Hypoxylon sp. FL0890]